MTIYKADPDVMNIPRYDNLAFDTAITIETNGGVRTYALCSARAASRITKALNLLDRIEKKTELPDWQRRLQDRVHPSFTESKK